MGQRPISAGTSNLTGPSLAARWQASHISLQLITVILLCFVLAMIASAIFIAILPTQPFYPERLPAYASAQTGPVRMPINLPEPAAGQVVAKIPLTLPQLPPEPDTPAPQISSLPLSEDMGAARDASPKARKPRQILAALSQTDGDQSLPIIGPDGLSPFMAYKSRLAEGVDDNKARIALIITGVGLNTARSEAAIAALPATISLGVSPYGQDPQRWITQAFDEERDALLMVPMEPNSFPSVDPGPDTLMRDAPELQTLQRLHRVLAKAQGYVGIINDTGSRFTANAIALSPVLDDVSARGLMVVDARASAYSVLASEAAKRKIPVAINTRYVDSSLTPEDIQRQLRDLERTAQTLGVAVGILRDLPITVSEVETWANTLDKNEFALVPISAVANQQPVR
ncbi:MAG: divergent polysaccharide deacetylase family protein [Pseudomonadota bacterium]